MDSQAGTNVQERHDSASSVDKNASKQTSHKSAQDHDTQYTTFPSPSPVSHPINSANSNSTDDESQRIEAKYARYTNAPPQYTEQEYEGKSEDVQTNMRMSDYAKEISRIMSRQIVRDLSTAQHNTKSHSDAE